MSATARTPRYWVVIPAAGRGQRMGAERPKQYLSLAGATVLEHALDLFLDDTRIAGIVVAVAPEDGQWTALPCASNPRVMRAPGGAERMHSVLNGLEALASRSHVDDWVLVHDAARPCVSRAELDRLVNGLHSDDVGGLLAVPVGDTLKRSDLNGVAVLETLDRRQLWRAQTPQMFRYRLLHRALTQAIADGAAMTDDSAAVEALGFAPKLIEGASTNIKLTRPDDLRLAEMILRARQ